MALRIRKSSGSWQVWKSG